MLLLVLHRPEGFSVYLSGLILDKFSLPHLLPFSQCQWLKFPQTVTSAPLIPSILSIIPHREHPYQFAFESSSHKPCSTQDIMQKARAVQPVSAAEYFCNKPPLRTIRVRVRIQRSAYPVRWIRLSAVGEEGSDAG